MGQDRDGEGGAGGLADRADFERGRRARRRQATRLRGLALVALAGGLLVAAASYARRAGPRTSPPGPSPHAAARPVRRASPDRPLADLAREAGLDTDPIPNARLVVEKPKLELRFHSGEQLLKTYPVALGFGGLGDKQRRDDGLTPEGQFRIIERVMQRNPRRWGDVWMLLDYPLPEDAERGLAAGLIDQDQRDQIVGAGERHETPLQDTRLGSGVGIHIGGVNPPDWTQGCIALERADGIEVCEQVRVGTPVVVQP